MWFEISGLKVLRSFRGTAVYENGIYVRESFYKWEQIRSYSWEYHDVLKLQFKYLKIKIHIKEELKATVEEILQTYITTADIS